MGTALGDEEERNALEVGRIVAADMFDRLLHVVHRGEVPAAEHEDERAEHGQVVLLQERDFCVHVVREHVHDSARPKPDSKRMREVSEIN